VKDGGVRHAPFWVLVGASRPSILVEVGYISHPTERTRLFTPRYQELISKGIAEGVDVYLNNRRKEIDL
jgi:N-acetylmuramoyl-L-alanine amidase